MVRKTILLCGALSLVCAAAAFAFPPIDLTLGQSNVAGVDGTIWGSNISQPTGTGVYQPFVREQANGDEAGFNTDAIPVPLDAKPGIWTHSVRFGDLGTATVGTTDYYVFQLDANEPNGPNDASKSYISLDTIRIYKGGAPGYASYTELALNGTLLYNMDGVSNQTVYIDTRLKQGSGTDDVTVFIPKSFFASAAGTDYMYFYSEFGNADDGGTFDGFSTADGFEEWRAFQGHETPPPPPIAEPGTMVLLGSGLAGLVGTRFRRKK